MCLVELRDLCRTKDENYRDILDHLGSQVELPFSQGCPIFLGTTYQNVKYVPNYHKIYQILMTLQKLPKF
jgi:hypothetical protein